LPKIDVILGFILKASKVRPCQLGASFDICAVAGLPAVVVAVLDINGRECLSIQPGSINLQALIEIKIARLAGAAIGIVFFIII
jgi:hypothetical protein